MITLLVCLAGPAVSMPICPEHGKRISCVVDGDTIWFEREKIRLLSIDAPELFSPKCSQEALQAREARDRLADLLNGEMRVEREGEDRYGRTLARVFVDGRDVGELLVREGLVRRWVGRREPWCG
ncbi:thermonuclease family protein [Pseudooceanicola nanhaiensis]|uniref:thermonuclease family protein n=1 Tax=Pseudooceanicola nanhaiensis TaxID=375761 RepID=UPI001CD37F52|nr:thermonuclease family protein [Pseudooceanicola nanhaiensis]MCA0920207.1 thermonuclease family protein [Pseudooceanicola nanhaiensis]